MRRNFITLTGLGLTAIFGSWVASLGSATPVETAFNYQGRLSAKGVPATGQYDLKFTLYDSENGQRNVGPTIQTNDLAVIDGLFSLRLDFGQVFNGTVYWLEICVRTNRADSFMRLARQPINATPWALYAAQAGRAASALSAVTAQTATTVAPNAVNEVGLLDGSVTATKIAPEQVVKSVNGLTDSVSFSAGIGLSLVGTSFRVAEGGVVTDLLADGAVTTNKISGSGAAAGQILKYDGTQWVFGEDNDTGYQPGPGLSLIGATFSVEYSGSGTALTAARSDHTHSAADLVAGILPTDRLSGSYMEALQFTHPSNWFVGVFSGDGSGLTNLSAGSLANGLISDARLSSNVALLNGSPVFSGAVTASFFAGDGSSLTNLDPSNVRGPLTVPQIVSVGTTNDGGHARSVAVSGNFAYLANETDGLRVYDISNLANPINVGHTNNGGSAWAVAVAGSYVYLANLDDGLRIYDVSVPWNPLNVGHINNGGQARGLALSGSYLYLANYDDGLRVYDITHPSSPYNVGHAYDGGLALGVAVSGAYAYLANDSDGLRIYDISDPATPISVGQVNDGGAAKGIAVAGGYAYVANGHDGLRIYDLIDPGQPLLVGHIDNGGEASGIAVVGSYAFLASLDDGLRVYDVLDPINPVEVGHVNESGSAQSVVVAGSHAFLASGEAGLQTYKFGFSVPTPFMRSFWELGGNARTSPALHFLGTTDEQAVEFKVNNSRALRLEPTTNSPNVIGGWKGNFVGGRLNQFEGDPRIVMPVGVTIAGGGASDVVLKLWNHAEVELTISNGVNLVQSSFVTIGGGVGNAVGNRGHAATIGGGAGNEIYTFWEGDAMGSTISGGLNNTVVDYWSIFGMAQTIGGGQYNSTASGYATIAGGGDNHIGTDCEYGTISGGGDNIISGGITYSGTIGGGRVNAVHANFGTVSGGSLNLIRGVYGTIGGGTENTVLGDASTIGGGLTNRASGSFSTVGGGALNNAAGFFATIPGGHSNVATDFSFAAGSRAQALHKGSFVWGDSYDADVFSTNANSWTIRASGGFRIFTDTNLTAGVQLFPGEPGWSAISDRNLKENFEPVDSKEVLERVSAMPIQRWNMKSQSSSTKHIGPMAQDFHAAFGVGEDNRHINSVDADGVALAAIQGVNQKVEEQAARIQALEETVAALKELVATLSRQR